MPAKRRLSEGGDDESSADGSKKKKMDVPLQMQVFFKKQKRVYQHNLMIQINSIIIIRSSSIIDDQ